MKIALCLCMLFFIFVPSHCDAAEWHEDRPIYWQDGYWTIFSYPDEDMCDLSAKTVANEHFTLGYFPRQKFYSFLLTNQNASSLIDGQEVTLSVVFIRGKHIDMGWGDRKFTVQKTGGQIAFSSPNLPHPIEEDFANSDTIALFRRDVGGSPVLVAGIDLSGSASAIEELKKCAINAAGLNSKDPFIK
jgi:hypothetical protein